MRGLRSLLLAVLLVLAASARATPLIEAATAADAATAWMRTGEVGPDTAAAPHVPHTHTAGAGPRSAPGGAPPAACRWLAGVCSLWPGPDTRAPPPNDPMPALPPEPIAARLHALGYGGSASDAPSGAQEEVARWVMRHLTVAEAAGPAGATVLLGVGWMAAMGFAWHRRRLQRRRAADRRRARRRRRRSRPAAVEPLPVDEPSELAPAALAIVEPLPVDEPSEPAPAALATVEPLPVDEPPGPAPALAGAGG